MNDWQTIHKASMQFRLKHKITIEQFLRLHNLPDASNFQLYFYQSGVERIPSIRVDAGRQILQALQQPERNFGDIIPDALSDTEKLRNVYTFIDYDLKTKLGINYVWFLIVQVIEIHAPVCDIVEIAHEFRRVFESKLLEIYDVELLKVSRWYKLMFHTIFDL
jgi:hypothetical protein